MNEFLVEKYKILNSFLKAILELIYPENISCIICNNPIKNTNSYSMCKSCFQELHFILDGCLKCGKNSKRDSLEELDIQSCSYCKGKSFYFDRAISCIEYSEFSKKIIFGLKYNKKTYISKYVATIMKEKLEIENIDFDYIMFVPLHKKRQRKRGFNQAQKIAKYLGELLDKPVIDVVTRKENTNRLYKLSKKKRKQELKGVFTLRENSIDIKNKKILLVDDIFTTGATANEISKLLKINLVNRITVVSFITRSV